MNILFVCTGNISRSFLAKALLLNEIKQNRIQDINVSSAGTGAYPGSPADNKMVNFLKEDDIPVIEHASRIISKEDIEWADQILVMEIHYADYINELWPEARNKVELLGKYIAPDDATEDEIPDPYGRSFTHYRLAHSQISLAVSNFFKIITEQK